MTLDAKITRILDGTDFQYNESSGDLRVGEVVVEKLNVPAHWAGLLPPDAMPRSPRGDQRERTVNRLVRDAVPDPKNYKEAALIDPDLSGESPGRFWSHPDISDPLMQRKLGDVLDDHFVSETARGGRFLFPFQTLLPANYKFPGQYKMFNGAILAFLAMPGRNGEQFNTPLLDQFYGLFNSRSQLSLLEREVVALAGVVAEDLGGAADAASASSEHLIAGLEQPFPGAPFLPEAHQLFQRDLSTALRMATLGRKDRVSAVLTVFYLHLALYFWRLAYLLEEQASAFLRFLADGGPASRVEAASGLALQGSAFAGQIRFRVAGGPERSYSSVDPSVAAHSEVNDRRLARLPLNLALLELSRRLAAVPAGSTFGDVARKIEAEESLRAEFDACCRAVAIAIAADMPDADQEEVSRQAEGPDPGMVAVSEAITKRRRKDFRRSGRDITAQLMKGRGSKGLIASRGPLVFFELGQELLVLVSKLVTQDETMRYPEFRDELRLYGLAPQDPLEEERFIEVLRSLQLLEKFSDSGESMYVKPIL